MADIHLDGSWLSDPTNGFVCVMVYSMCTCRSNGDKQTGPNLSHHHHRFPHGHLMSNHEKVTLDVGMAFTPLNHFGYFESLD